MSSSKPTWAAGDREKRQRVSQELAQLKQMSKSLRAKAMRSFMKRAEADRLDVKPPATPVKPSVAA
jgi:hypothetical protein